MYYGTFYLDEEIKIIVPTHRFESGQKYNGVVDLNYAKMGVEWGSHTEVSMTLVDSLTGVYQKIFSAGSLEVGLYWGVVVANIDLVYVHKTIIWRVTEKPMWLLGMF